jgi:hypothetical protein
LVAKLGFNTTKVSRAVAFKLLSSLPNLHLTMGGIAAILAGADVMYYAARTERSGITLRGRTGQMRLTRLFVSNQRPD